MSFFDKLRKGVTNIETEVKQLKQMVENDSNELTPNDLREAKLFDRDLRQLYVDVTTLYNTIKGQPVNLNDIQYQINNMKTQLKNLENDSGLKNYGYKPFADYDLKPTAESQLTSNLDIVSINRPVIETFSSENTISSKLLFDEITQKTNQSEDRTPETAKYIDVSEADPKISENEAKAKNNKLDKYLGRTPQPYDFGITRRYTLVPQLLLNNKNNSNNNDNNNKYKAVDKTPDLPTYDSTTTCRFNYLTTGLNFQSSSNVVTPPNASSTSVNGADSFVTVEFTPGLTTKRPKGISRIEDNNRENKTNENIRNNQKSVLQSVENDKITPEQPIPTTNCMKSAKLLKSIGNTGTPPLPQTRVNVSLHNKLLMKK